MLRAENSQLTGLHRHPRGFKIKKPKIQKTQRQKQTKQKIQYELKTTENKRQADEIILESKKQIGNWQLNMPEENESQVPTGGGGEAIGCQLIQALRGSRVRDGSNLQRQVRWG